jgi:hypothetical protein
LGVSIMTPHLMEYLLAESPVGPFFYATSSSNFLPAHWRDVDNF